MGNKWQVKSVDVFGETATASIWDTRTLYDRDVVFIKKEGDWEPKDRESIKYLPKYLIKEIRSALLEQEAAVALHKAADERKKAAPPSGDIVEEIGGHYDIDQLLGIRDQKDPIWMIWHRRKVFGTEMSDVTYVTGKDDDEAESEFFKLNRGYCIDEIQRVTRCGICGEHDQVLKLYKGRPLCQSCERKEMIAHV